MQVVRLDIPCLARYNVYIYPYQGGRVYSEQRQGDEMASEVKQKIDEPHAASPVQEPAEACRAVFALEGMSCASCAMRIEKGLKKVPGVLNAEVNLASERGTVTYDPAQTSIEQMVRKVEAVGYKAIPLQRPAQQARDENIEEQPGKGAAQEDEQSRQKRAQLTRKRNLLILGIILTLPVVLLTTPVWAIVGWEFHRNALKTLRHGGANMDTLISVGSTAAYALSVVATFFPQVVGSLTFYDTTALIVTLIFL